MKQAMHAKRRALKRQASVKWADQEAIKAYYDKADPTLQVDHIYPLTSDWVCGLHVETNLQLLSAKDNCAKGNRRYDEHHFERQVLHPKYAHVVGLVKT